VSGVGLTIKCPGISEKKNWYVYFEQIILKFVILFLSISINAANINLYISVLDMQIREENCFLLFKSKKC
jgi:hypothetical protein